jgi:hypothetical protein
MGAFDETVNDPENLGIFIQESLAFALAGLIAGSMIDASFIQLAKLHKHKAYKVFIAFAQVVAGIIGLYILWRASKSIKFGDYWQNTIPGLAFPAFYFGIQSNIYTTLQSFYI